MPMSTTQNLSLFDGDRLGQVAGLVDVGAALEGDVVGEELAGDRVGDAGQFVADGGEVQDVVCDLVDLGGAFGDKGEDGSAAGLDLHEVAEHFFEGVAVAAHADDDEVGVDEGDRAVFHFAGGIALGIDVADLFKFEGGLEAGSEHVVAAEEEEAVVGGVFFGQRLDGVVLMEDLFDFGGKGLDLVKEGLSFFFAHVAQAGHEEGEKGKDGELAGEGLGRADADLGAGAEEEGAVGFAGKGGVADVADAEDFGAFAFDFADGGNRIEGLARLADGDDEGAVGDDRVFVAKLGGDLRLGRDAGFVFEEGGGDLTGVPGGAAGEDHDPFDGEEVGGGKGEVFKLGGAELRDQAVMKGLLDRLGLFEDLFEHIMRIAVLRKGCGSSFEAFSALLDGGGALVEDFDLFGADQGDLVGTEEHHVEVWLAEGVGVGGDEGFRAAGINADGDRILPGGGDDLVGVVFVDQGDPPESAEVGEGFLDGGEELPLVKVGDQLGDHFRVGVGVEGPALGLEHLAEGKVVFDDSVVDDSDRLVLIEVGVGVFPGGFPMGGPAGMGDGQVEAHGLFAESAF